MRCNRNYAVGCEIFNSLHTFVEATPFGFVTSIYPRISDKGRIGQGSDQDLAELARLHALFDVEMRFVHHS